VLEGWGAPDPVLASLPLNPTIRLQALGSSLLMKNLLGSLVPDPLPQPVAPLSASLPPSSSFSSPPLLAIPPSQSADLSISPVKNSLICIETNPLSVVPLILLAPQTAWALRPMMPDSEDCVSLESLSPGTPGSQACSLVLSQPRSPSPKLIPMDENEELTLTISFCLQLDPVSRTVDWDFIVTWIQLMLAQENDLGVRVIVGMEDEYLQTVWLAFSSAEIAACA
jgi:hypothetical protein